MNLFDNIINQSKANFLGTQSTQTVPSFMQPQAPRTTNYIAPAPVQTKQPVLFANEKVTYQKMLSDGLSEQEAQNLVKQHRDSLYPIKDFTPQESATLRKMASDGLTSYEAIDLFKQNRQQKAKEGTKIQDMHADEGVVEQTLKAPFRAIGDVASQTWQGIGKGTEGLLDASFRGVNDLNKMIGSSDYSPELEKQLPQGGYLGDVAKIGAGTTGAVFNLGKAPLALGINTANQLPGAQYITQGIGKGIQYGAEQLGGLAGVDKETSMDLATTGMNLFGMKPGMNTLQYGKGIVNAPGVMGKAGAIVKPVGESVVQTVKMPYDIAKGTIKGGVNLAKKVGPSIATASDAIQTGLNRMTKGEINKFQAEQGVSPGKYLNDRNIVSSGKPIEETLLEQMKASRDQATAGTEAIVGNFKMPTKKFGDSEISYMREMLKDNYRHAKKTLDAEGTNQAKQLLDKYDTQGLTMGEINTAKRKMADNNPVNWNTDHASPRVQTVKRISDAVRNWQFDQAVKSGFTNLKEINKQTQAFYKLHEGITKWNDGIEANNKISLTDYLAFDADPSVFVAKKVLSSPYVRQGIVKGLNKISGRVVKPIEKATIDTINTKRAEYDYGNRNSNTGDRVVTGKQLALPAPSGKPVSANVVNVKPIVMPKKLSAGISENAKIRDPRVKANDDYLELKSLEEALNIGDEVAKSKARTAFNKKIQQVKIEMDRAIYERVMSREMKKIVRENYDSIYPQGMQTVFNKLKGYTKNKGNYNDIEGESGSSILKKQFSDYTNEYNEKMGTNYTVNEMWDIFDDRYRKTPVKEIKKPIVTPTVPKKTVNAPIAKKSGVESKVETNKDIFDEDTRKVLFEYQPKGYNVPKNADIYPSESGIGVSYKGKGRVDFYISTKDGKIKVSTDHLGGNATDFIQDAWKRVGKDMESKITPSSNAKQQGIKPKSTTTNVFGETIKKPSNKKGGFIKVPGTSPDIKPIKKLNTGEEITLVRGTGGKGSGAGEAIRGKGLYLTDNVDVAKHYGPELKTVTLKNSDILDGGETLKNSRQIIQSLPKEMKAYLDDTFDYSYNSLIKTIEGNTGIEAEAIAEALNSAIKGKYKGVKFEIGLVNDSLMDRGLGNKNAFVIF